MCEFNLKESEIKRLFIESKLLDSNIQTIACEVPFEFGSRRADIVVDSVENLTVYEIKGASDSLERLEFQIKSYVQYFDYCFVICEPSNLNNVRRLLKPNIGIILVSPTGIKKVREAKLIRRLNKISLASTIPSGVLKKTLSKNLNMSQYELCLLAARKFNLKAIKQLSRESFTNLYKRSYLLLKNDVNHVVSSDDLITISRNAPKALIKRP